MRWHRERRSGNIDDRRVSRGPSAPAAVGLGGVGLLVVLLVATVLGVDPTQLLEATRPGGGALEPHAAIQADAMADFASQVLADTEDTWDRIFAERGQRYQEPTLVLFTGAVQSACGFAEAAVGPFYCPGDQMLYLDLAFFEDLERQFAAPGDFAQAYVIAHEVGHHVQTLLGITQQVARLRSRQTQAEQNNTSVLVELQADCFAGVWANRAQEMRLVLDAEDIEEGLRAASAVGDDRIQHRTRGYVVPDSFTHGSSAQRVAWFRRGLESGDPNVCDTFGQ